MSDFSVTERRLRPIIDAVQNRNWKQALQQCDKWQKKGEKSDRFLALKALVLINQPDKSQVEKGKIETLQLCRRNPAITDIEALDQLQESLRYLSLHKEEGPKLWERAIAAKPDDTNLLTTLLNGSVSDGNWMSAQKAAMALRKALPKERQYDFWNMLLCYLIHQDNSLTQKDRDTFGRLAFMLISKAAEGVPSDKNQLLTTGKAIATPEELALLVKIYKATGNTDQVIKLLQSNTLGLESRVAELDPQFVFSLLLEALEASENHQEVFNLCKSFIESGSPVSTRHREDDRIWNVLQSLSRKPQGVSIDMTRSCSLLAQSTFQSDPQCRAAYLAYFDLANSADHDNIASACAAYFEAFKSKPFCFSDLIQSLMSNKSTRNLFRSKVNFDEDDLIQRVFDLKLRHACLDSEQESSTEVDYLNIVADAMRLHKQLPKERNECPEMVLLAATALLRLASKTQNDTYILQASYLLHNCYLEFNEYYPIAIRQLQLHVVQGQISLAIEKFASLAVKNLQWETVGHFLLTRMSTLHPLNSRNVASKYNPLASLDAALVVLHNSDRQLEQAIHDGLKAGSYSNIIDVIDIKGKLIKSMNRQIFLAEERRIQRLVGIPQDLAMNPYPAGMVDQRDFSFLPDLGKFTGQEAFEKSLTCGPLPGKTWLVAIALHDHLTTYLRAELASQQALGSTAFDRLKTTLGKVSEAECSEKLDLTQEEANNLSCHQYLSNLVIWSKDGPNSKQSEFKQAVVGLQSWLNGIRSAEAVGLVTLNHVEIPTWQFLHTSFSRLETLQTISLFLSFQVRRNKNLKAGKVIMFPKDVLAELQQNVIEAEQTIHGQAETLKDRISASGVLGRLVEAASGRADNTEHFKNDAHQAPMEAFKDLIDEAELETFCGRLRDSWEDALDGILKVKIKVTK